MGVKVNAALGSLSTGSEPLPICDWQGDVQGDVIVMLGKPCL
jgi:hypothetical protein